MVHSYSSDDEQELPSNTKPPHTTEVVLLKVTLSALSVPLTVSFLSGLNFTMVPEAIVRVTPLSIVCLHGK